MKPYIFGERNGIYIIDLQKTLKLFQRGRRVRRRARGRSGKRILFVGTKRQAQDVDRRGGARAAASSTSPTAGSAAR